MALPIAAAGAAMIPGFFGGLGYGTGLQYSYARGFPAFAAGGPKAFVDVIKQDTANMLGSFTQGMLGSGNNSIDTGGLMSTDEWEALQLKNLAENQTKNNTTTKSAKAEAKKWSQSVGSGKQSQKDYELQQLERQYENAKGALTANKKRLSSLSSTGGNSSQIRAQKAKIQSLEKTVASLRKHIINMKAYGRY